MNKVRLIKILLGAGAALITLGLFVLSGPGRQMVEMADQPTAQQQTRQGQDKPRPGLQDVASTVMTNPRFFGEDSNNRRWEIKAERAEQSMVEGHPAFELKSVSAVAEISQGRPLSFEAGQGRYVPESKIVILSHGVQVQGYGYTVRTSEVQYDLTAGTGMSRDGIAMSGPRGELSAQHMNMRENGRLLTLSGDVAARIYPQGEQ